MSHKILSKNRLLLGAASAAMATLMAAAPAQAVVPNDSKTPNDIVDTAGGVNGIGQMIIIADTGGVGLCTGTLINPRTVLFAAHCVNSRVQTAYAANNGDLYPPRNAATDGRPMSFMFNVNNRSLMVNGRNVDPLIEWIFSGYQSNASHNVFTVNQVFYHPDTNLDADRRPLNRGFLEADVALASLDTPAAAIPTWALLFSPLPDPGELDYETGTGYHVNISGYGRTGSGTTGSSSPVDYRRKAAENMIGALTSLNVRDQFFFGDDPEETDLPQVLYFTDFDDPKRDLENGVYGNRYGFNANMDQALPNEGATAGGDSGSGLILDAANNAITTEDLMIAVLSGGSRFYQAQPDSSYGGQSFFQPLFLYWDFIAENNPYHYVTAKAGDGNWEDASHWESMLDPNYRVINADGAIVNGIPDNPGAERLGDTPQWGSTCAEFNRPTDICLNHGTGEFFTPAPGTNGSDPEVEGGEETDVNTDQNSKAVFAVVDELLPAEADIILASEAQTETGNVAAKSGAVAKVASDAALGDMTAINTPHNVEMVINTPHNPDLAIETPHEDGDGDGEEEAQAPPGYTAEELPPATIDNGLPGATDFVPNNVDPIIDIGATGEDDQTVDAQYYDVTLANAGTTTLSSEVTIDNLMVMSTATLNIAKKGDLTSLIEVQQTGGEIHVDGHLSSVGDYTMTSGVLSGTGTVTAPYVTVIGGVISPGEANSIGTLTIDGNLVMASAASYAVTVGANNASDKIFVTGDASIGGVVNPILAPGFIYSEGSVYRIFEANGTVTQMGSDGNLTTNLTTGFDSVAPISAIIYGSLETGKEAIAVPAENEGEEATSFDRTFVNLRINFRDYYDVVGGNSLVQAAYSRLMDRNDRTGSLAELYNQLDYMSAAEIADTFERLAPFTESTVRTTAKAATIQANRFYRTRINNVLNGDYGGTIATLGTPMQMAANMGNGYGAAPIAASAANSATTVQDNGSMNSDWAAYLAGGYLDGSGKGMPAALSNNRDNFDGYFITGGLEYLGNDNTIIGLSVYYSDIDGNAALNQSADAKLWQGTLYGAYQSDSMGLVFDGLISAGNYKAKTRRDVTIGANAYNLRSSDNSFAFVAEGGVSYPIEVYGGAYITPRAAINYTTIDFSDVNETGGAAALQIERDRYESLQGRIGMSFSGKKDARVKPYFYADFVYDYLDHDDRFGANWVGSTAQVAPFQLSNYDSSWGEMGLGITYNGDAFDITAAVDTTVGSQDVRSQSYSLTARFQF